MQKTKTQDGYKFYTYVYRDPVTNKPFYVGKGTKNRHRSHLFQRNHYNQRLQRKIEKIRPLGLEPIVQKVLEGVTDDRAKQEEIRLIALWGRKGYETGGILTNHTLGEDGRSGYHFPAETVKKIADKQRGIPRPHTRGAVSEGTKKAMSDPAIRQKIRDAKTGKPCPESTKQKLSIHFAETRRGTGNPAAKTWKVVSPEGTETVTGDLVRFCGDRGLSYVGLKAAYRNNRPVLKGSSKGWSLYQLP